VSTRKKDKQEIIGLVGLGLDNDEGHRRLTRAEDILLLGGSRETHETMQEMVIRFDEALRKRGKRLREASVDEVIDLLDEASES
jgi:hypothetical protein